MYLLPQATSKGKLVCKKEVGRRPLLSGIAKRPYIRRQTTHRKCECLCLVYSSKFGDFDRKGTPLFSVK